MTTRREQLTKEVAATVATIETGATRRASGDGYRTLTRPVSEAPTIPGTMKML
jgi:hypothetical protein